MKNSQNITRIAGLAIALAITVPVSAAEEGVPHHKGNTTAQLMATKTTIPSRTGEAQQTKGSAPAATTAQKKESASDQDQMPYVTYDGAANAPSDH